jgi:DnaJ-class molecular chaperone
MLRNIYPVQVGKPDEERAAAEKRFQEVQKAYEVREMEEGRERK